MEDSMVASFGYGGMDAGPILFGLIPDRTILEEMPCPRPLSPNQWPRNRGVANKNPTVRATLPSLWSECAQPISTIRHQTECTNKRCNARETLLL